MKAWLKSGLIILLIGFAVFLLGTSLQQNGFAQPLAVLLKSLAIYELYSLIMYFSHRFYFGFISRNFKGSENLKKHIIFGFSGSLLVTLLVLVVLRFIVRVFFFGEAPESFLVNSKGYFYFGINITLIVTLLFYIFYFYKASSEKKVTESQVVAKTETAKYESLKSQLDPHFLFNSLNVLTSLIGENPVLAERFTTKLSKVYRYVLEQKNKDLIPLNEELDFAKTYMDLLKMRFEDAVVYEIPEEISNSELKIVPLSLQILLENAVKHNVISSEFPLKVKIYEEEGNLLVENNLNKKDNVGKSTKIGLSNIKDRYALITKRPFIVEDKNRTFKVTLPLLTQKIKTMSTDHKILESKYLRAKQKVEEIKGFYASLISYIIVIPFLIFIYYRFTPFTIQWFWFPIFGWGIGLVFQGFSAFGNPIFGRGWEERKIKEIMDEEDKTLWQ
ncbi:2TM domain-containing protein [Namhaeicola litoreus]|uniref:2TM domain-containing protein n=1 Tax=Namhaeicola litoreus TaxID=1052145 RepID=A0ABW3Y6B0_9FLAO